MSVDWIERPVTIVNRLGLHARAAAKLVTLAAEFDSEVYLVRETRQVDAKSIMGVLMLAASKGTALTLKARGNDAEAAVEALADLIQRRFDEAS
ncbi:MAG: HPr family phosphocarrier protein [Candidatus Competibacterales bacterium]